ncbi:hypothetical protein [Spartinivicinus ruber]|uniref:hypothetical protein n=1 Tax=Spartinivicinus ruber TaxID=2683272 RepID=UPI0013D31565|nr:hypothetical protein [Spartinivicinus ruber]
MRIRVGLQKAIEDGSFNELFYSHPTTKKIFELANIANRLVIDLDNPFLTKKTKVIVNYSKLWYRPGEETLHK